MSGDWQRSSDRPSSAARGITEKHTWMGLEQKKSSVGEFASGGRRASPERAWWGLKGDDEGWTAEVEPDDRPGPLPRT